MRKAMKLQIFLKLNHNYVYLYIKSQIREIILEFDALEYFA